MGWLGVRDRTRPHAGGDRFAEASSSVGSNSRKSGSPSLGHHTAGGRPRDTSRLQTLKSVSQTPSQDRRVVRRRACPDPSVDTSKPAIGGRVKTGHTDGAPRRVSSYCVALLGTQVGVDLGPPAARSALEDVGVVQEAIEQRGDGGGVAEQLAPVVDGAVRGEQRATRVRSGA